MLKITALYTSLCVLTYLSLCYVVVRHRRREKVDIGDGNHTGLSRAIRAQANAVEYMPFVILLMAFSEANAAPLWLLHIVGAAFVFARIIHPIGFIHKKGKSFGRFYGTLITWLILLGLSILNILYFFRIL